MKRVTLFVEGNSDVNIVSNLLIAAGLPLDRVDIQIGAGKANIVRLLETQALPDNAAVLLDADELFVADARRAQQAEWEGMNVHLFFAVPMIEAWIFADDELALTQIRHEARDQAPKRLPFPDEIPFPKDLALRFFGNAYARLRVDFLQEADIGTAVSRSPSLRDFLLGMSDLLGVSKEKIEHAVNQHLDLKIIENLLREVLDSQTVVYKTLDGRNITAAEMRKNISEAGETGKMYAADLLRVSRDFLRRKANPKITG
jgi:hypothetical protein